MAEILAVTLGISIIILISISWVNGIDKSIKYEKENPDADPDAGWLNWDKKSTKTK